MADSELWIGQVYTSASAITVGATPKTPTAGYYYLAGPDSDDGDALVGDATGALAHLEDLINDVYANASVSLNYSTGIVTIAFGTTGTLAWGSSEFKAICGFESDIGSSTGANGTLPAKGWWAASRAASGYPLDREVVWNQETTTRTVRATDGSSFAVTGSSSAARAEISYRYLTRDEMVRDADPERGTLEQFFIDVAAAGLPLRYIPDATIGDGDQDGLYSSTGYVQGFWELSEESSRFTDFATRSVEGYDGLWDVTIPLIKYDA